MFVWLFVWGLSSHSRLFHSLPMKGYKASIYNGHLRGPVTLTPNAEHLSVELSLPVLTTQASRGWYSNTPPSACGAKEYLFKNVNDINQKKNTLTLFLYTVIFVYNVLKHHIQKIPTKTNYDYTVINQFSFQRKCKKWYTI